MSEKDPGELADRLERETNDLSGKSDDLEGKVREVSQDWERKRADGEAPGAPPDQGEMGARERGEHEQEPSGEGEQASGASAEEDQPSQDEEAHEGSGNSEERDRDENSH